MSFVYVSIGTSSATLVQMTKPVSQSSDGLSIGRQEKTKNKTTWHGHRNVAVLGQRKKVYEPEFTYVPQDQYNIFNQYGSSSRRWYVVISGSASGGNIFSGYAYLQLENVKVTRVTDGQNYYNLKLLIFEV